MVNVNVLRDFFVDNIPYREYYHIIVCCDRIAETEFEDKEELKEFIVGFFDYIDELVIDDFIDELWGVING